MMNEFERNVPTLLSTFLALTCVTAAIGLFGNIALIRTFWKQRNQHRFNKLMITLAVFDGLFLVSMVSLEAYRFRNRKISLGSLYDTTDSKWTTLLYVNGVLFSSSMLTALLISFERCLALSNNR